MSRLPFFLLFTSFLLLGVHALNPIVFFPGYSFSKLNVTVTNGDIDGCPSNGNFVVEFAYNTNQSGFTERCMLLYLNLTYNPNGAVGKKFSNRADVSVTIPGRTTGDVNLCIGGRPTYDNFFNTMITKGYNTTGGATGGATLTAACYDWRIDPGNDALAGPSFMSNTQTIIEKTYANAGNNKVWLVGHSNGPIMTLYFLNQMTDAWKQQYVAGFIPLSGDFAGVGAFYGVLVNGLSLFDFTFYAPTAPVMQYWTGNLFSLAQPSVFVGSDVHIFTTKSPPRNYSVTEADINDALTSANQSFALAHWKEYVGLVTVDKPPGVYTYALWGAGFDTAVGLIIESFTNTAIIDYNLKPGDINQEYIDNESPKKWAATMPPGCFEYFQVDGVNHFELTSNAGTIDKIYAVINKGVPTVVCSNSTTSTTSSISTTAAGATITTAAASATSTTSFASSVHANIFFFVSVLIILLLL